MPSSLATQLEHKDQLDGLRFWAFFAVFLQHSEVFMCPELGFVGVRLFFVISGFLITRLLLLTSSGNLWHDLRIFYIRRTLRIFPLYYLVLTGFFFLHLVAFAAWFYFYIGNVKIFLEPKWTAVVIYPYWSLCVEEQFYLLYPPIILLTPVSKRLYLLILLIAASIVSRIAFSYAAPGRLYDLLLPNAGQSILWGCLAAYVDLKNWLSNWRVVNGTRLFLIGALLLLSLYGFAMFGLPDIFFMLFFDKTGLRDACHHVLFGVSSLAMAFIVIGLWRTENSFLLKTFRFAPLVYLGKISYGMYIFHVFILNELVWNFGLYPHGRHAVAAFFLTLCAASLTWFLYENPLNKLKRFFPYRVNQTGASQGQ